MEVCPVASSHIVSDGPLRIAGRVVTAYVVITASLLGLAPTSALTLDAFGTRFEGNVAGDFVLTGNTVLTCSTTAGALGAASCGAARTRQGNFLDNDNHFMRHLEVPVGGLPSADVFNSSSNVIRIPAGAEVLYAELFWSGSLLSDAGDVSAPSPTDKDQVLFAVGDDDCTVPVAGCDVSALSVDVVQETLGSDLGQYRASAVVTSRLQDVQWTSSKNSWESIVTVGNIQTTQGLDKAAGWSLAVVFSAPGHELRHVQVLGGFGVVARRSGATVPLDGFLTPSTGDVRSSIGLVAFDGDLGDASDSAYLRQASSQTVLEDNQNPEINIANSTIASGGALSPYLSDTSADRSSNTFGVDVDRIDLTNALAHGSTQTTLVMSAQQDTWFPTALAYSTELPSADVQVLKYVSDVSGGSATAVDTGDVLTYTLHVTNVGNGSAASVIVRDEIPADLTLTSSLGTDCPTVPIGYVCKVIDTLAPGASTDITITGTVNGSSQLTTGYFMNQAEAEYTSHLGNSVAISNTVTIEYGPLAVDLMSDVQFDDDYIQAGNDTRVIATITNLGPVSDDNPSVDLLITQGAAAVVSLPTGCVRLTATRIACMAEAFGINGAQPLVPGESKSLSMTLRPESDRSHLLVKHVVHAGVAAGDSNPSNDISYAQLAINHPPVAKPFKITARMGGASVTASFTTYVSDPDDDALHIRVASAAHGSLLQLGTRIKYTPPSRWSGMQRINYTVSDGKGGMDQSYITIVVTRPTTPTTTSDSGHKPDTGGRKCVVIRAGC